MAPFSIDHNGVTVFSSTSDFGVPLAILHSSFFTAGENILLDDAGNVKLCDFGLGVQLTLDEGFTTDRGCAPCEKLGTLYWMAPEVALKQSYGRAADIW